jgi:hypothetical protein
MSQPHQGQIAGTRWDPGQDAELYYALLASWTGGLEIWTTRSRPWSRAKAVNPASHGHSRLSWGRGAGSLPRRGLSLRWSAPVVHERRQLGG